MRLLLDTHSMYWYIEDDPQLSGRARTLIQDASNEILVSPASYWEIAIKISIGKWRLNRPYEEFIDIGLNQYGFSGVADPAHAHGSVDRAAVSAGAQGPVRSVARCPGAGGTNPDRERGLASRCVRRNSALVSSH